jgi:hypothetical protein
MLNSNTKFRSDSETKARSRCRVRKRISWQDFQEFNSDGSEKERLQQFVWERRGSLELGKNGDIRADNYSGSQTRSSQYTN